MQYLTFDHTYQLVVETFETPLSFIYPPYGIQFAMSLVVPLSPGK